MEKTKSKKLLLLKFIFSILICIVCMFSFVGCSFLEFDQPTSSNDNIGDGDDNDTDNDDNDDDDTGTQTPTYPVYAESFVGAIGVYEIGADENVFYDAPSNQLTKFSTIADRQFTAMSNVIYDTLYRIYGEEGIVTSPNSIRGYGQDLTYQFSNIITTDLQSILSGIDSGMLTNSNLINYTNAINGGYTLNGDGSGYTNTLIDNNKWNIVKSLSVDNFNTDFIKKALIYIYCNPYHPSQVALDANGFDFLIEESMANYYRTFLTSKQSEIDSINIDSVTHTGLNREFLYNVVYFLGYSVIGNDNLINSINNPSKDDDNVDKIFTVSGNSIIINDFTAENVSAYQNYKGYADIIVDIVDSISNMSIGSSGKVSFSKEYFTENYDISNRTTTLFPIVSNELLIYYPDVETLQDGVFSETETNLFIGGKARKLKSIIILPNETSNEGITIDGVLVAIHTSENDSFMIEFDCYAIYGEDNVHNKIIANIANQSDSRLTITNNFDVQDAVDIELYSGVFKQCTLDGSLSAENMVKDSFRTSEFDIQYQDGITRKKLMGHINVYNSLYNVDGSYGFKNNVFICDFIYYDSSGNPMAEIPETYINFMQFYNN